MPDRSAAIDEQAVLDELYGLRPEGFTAARTRHATRARQAGDRALAARLTALRRPTSAAWASNQLVRAHPEQVEPILRLGEGLRRAHRELDGGQLRELTQQQRSLVQALSAQARRLAAEAGQPLHEGAVDEVEQTLHAALADPDAARQWAAGRLTRALSASVDLAGTTSPLAPAPQRTQERTRTKAGAAERERQGRIAQARRQAEADAREAAARADAAATARRTLDAAEADLDRADADLERLTGELRRAEAAQSTAQNARHEAEHRWRLAEAAAEQAQQQAASSAEEAGSA